MRNLLMPRLTLRRVAAAFFAVFAATAQAADGSLPATLARYNVQEAAQPARAHASWQAPRKILFLQMGQPLAQMDAMRATVPKAQIVVVNDVNAALAQVVDTDVLVGYNPAVCDPRIHAAAQRLRWVVSLSAGVELCVPLPNMARDKPLMTNMRGIDSPIIAEHAIALLLALAHGLDRFALDTANANWSRNSAATVPMQFMEGKTMLVSGLGGIGTEIARRAHGLGMKVVGTRVGGGPRPDFVSYIGQPDELLKLAAAADVVVSAVPLTRATTNLYDAKFFATLKPTAFFINIARGGSVVTDALMAALNEGRLAGAGLDVVEPEPLPADHPLWKSPRILFTPHISSRSDTPNDARWVILQENLRRYAAGEKLLNQVDLRQGF
jgi:phosphoglycerate dehydrogenase-like enzyme